MDSWSHFFDDGMLEDTTTETEPNTIIDSLLSFFYVGRKDTTTETEPNTIIDSLLSFFYVGRKDTTTETEPNTGALKWEIEKDQVVLDNVHELLECPVCYTTMSAPIYQCQNGHPLCSMCKFGVKDCCPICRTDMGSIRCLALEKIAKPWEVTYDCPCDNDLCKFTGNIPEIITHLQNDVHRRIVRDGCEISVEATTKKMNPMSLILTVYNCYGCYFLLYLDGYTFGNANGYVVSLRFLGEENEAKRFSYSLEVGRDGQELTYRGVPRSIRVHDENFLNDGMFISPSFWEVNEQSFRLILTGQISQN